MTTLEVSTDQLFNDERISALAADHTAFKGADIQNVAEAIKDGVHDLFPKYIHKMTDAFTALDRQAGNCMHRTAAVHSVASHIPNLLSGVMRDHHGDHAYNLLAATDSDTVVVLENNRDNSFNISRGIFYNYSLYLPAEPDIKYLNYAAANVLRAGNTGTGGIHQYYTEPDESYNLRVIEPSNNTERQQKPSLLLTGGAALKFVNFVAAFDPNYAKKAQ